VKLILTESVRDLGNIGEIVDVSNGYGRNFLMLTQKAIPATPANLKMLQGKLKRQLAQEAKTMEQASELAAMLEEVSLTAVVQVGEEDRMFGSVTQQHIADLMKEKGYDIDRRKIHLDEPIKALGIYTIPIALHARVEANVKLWVVKE
jgi:large subunit ribosomal protein L9